MEAVGSGARQSASTSANNSDTHQTSSQHPCPPQSYREPSERPHHELPAMATATVLQPGSTYPPPSSSYPSSYLPPSSSINAAAEQRRSPEESDPATRPSQSLPSISEVISNTATQYPAPAAPPPPPAQQAGTSFPSPFSGPPRSHGEAEKQASPHGPAPGSSFAAARREPLPAYGESPRAAYNARPGLPALPDRRASPSIKSEYPHAYAHDAHKDPRAPNGAYPQPPAPAAAPSNSYPPGPLPQGQMPLPSYPPSPRHGPPQTYPGYDQRGHPNHMDEADRVNRAHYEPPIYSTPWSYGETLGRLAQSARTTFQFAEAYGRIAQEQHGPQPIPERLPTEQEVADMLSNNEMQRAALDRLREVIAQSIRNERAREPPKHKATYQDDQDLPMFEDGPKAHYNITEVKKRRGRAAPPGRCHSCNRVDTPEWRRGPDGARTLCNACGLHYAKLERKRQLEQRNIRPKPDERA